MDKLTLLTRGQRTIICSDAQKDIIGSSRIVELSITVSGEPVHQLADNYRMEMTLDDWTSSESPVVVYVSDDRVYEKIEFEYSAGSKTLVWFEDHHSVFDVMESMPEIDVEPEPQVELEKTGSDNTMLVVVGVILLIITVATVVFYTRKN